MRQAKVDFNEMRFDIVKVQLPVDGRTGPAMIYNKSRSHLELRYLNRTDMKMMNHAYKVYCKATWSGDKWILAEKVEAQEW